MKTGANIDKPMVGYLLILVDLVNEKMGKGYSNSGKCLGIPFMIPLYDIHYNIESEM